MKIKILEKLKDNLPKKRKRKRKPSKAAQPADIELSSNRSLQKYNKLENNKKVEKGTKKRKPRKSLRKHSDSSDSSDSIRFKGSKKTISRKTGKEKRHRNRHRGKDKDGKGPRGLLITVGARKAEGKKHKRDKGKGKRRKSRVVDGVEIEDLEDLRLGGEGGGAKEKVKVGRRHVSSWNRKK